MEIAQGILSKLGECLVELTVNQARYLICFKSIVKELEVEESNLKLAQESMEQRVEAAIKNTEIIEKDVEKWQTDISNILAEVQRLKEEIEVKKSFFNGWCPNWGSRYSLSRETAKKVSIMIKLRDSGNNLNSVGHPAPLPGIEFSAPKYFDFFQSSKAAFDKIIEALRKDEISLVGLYGMGGAGKTSLAIKLGVEVKKKEIFDEVVMVAVSHTPNFKDIQSKLARLLDIDLKEEDEEERAKRLYLRFMGTNRETNTKTKKIFVILDDVWENFDLKSKVGFPLGEDNKHCKLLLTTRKKNLCTAIGCQLRISLNLLNEDEGLTLLKRHAGLTEDSLALKFNTLAIEVARECKGLPLALATVGSALKEREIYEWKLVLEMLKTSKLDDIYDVVDVNVDVAVYACLKLSYDYLRDEKTKFCFLLCSLFPEDYRIHAEELVPYGMGLDLFPGTNSFEEVKSRLHVTLNNLKASCLLLDANEKCVKMHDVVRDVALWITAKGNNEFMTKRGKGLIEWSNEKGWEERPKLKILLLSDTVGKNMLKISSECFKAMVALKILILQSVDVSIKSLESLMNLKVLQLFDCTLRDVSYLEKLKKLEVLCLRSSSGFDRFEELVRIPSKLILQESTLDRLPSLTSFFSQNQHSTWPTLEVLEISKCSNLTAFFISEVKMQNDQTLGVSSLQNLTKVHVSKCHKLKNLFPVALAQNLLHLRELAVEECVKLEQFIFKDHEEDHLQANEVFRDKDGVRVMNDKEIALFPQLKKLSLKALPNLTRICPAGYQLLLNLESLRMEGFQDDQIVGEILSCLRNVKTLYIFYCGIKELKGLCKSSTYILALHNLITLSIANCHKLRRIVVPNPSQLKELRVEFCEKLEEISIVEVEDDEENHKDRPPADNDDVRSYHKQVVLSQLEYLEFAYLGSLANFYPMNYHFIFPSLRRLIVVGCLKIETRFSYREADGSVHAEGKPPNEGGNYDEDTLLPPEPALFIDCHGSAALRKKLPPYVEETKGKGSPSSRE